MQAIETFRHAGVVVNIHQDDEGGELANPRDNDGNVGVLVFDHGVDTGLGEESLDTLDIEVRNPWKECPRCEGTNVINKQTGKYDPGEPGDEENCPDCNGGQITMTIPEYFEEFFDALIALPIRYSDFGSGGQRIETTTEDNANGVIFATEASVKDAGIKPDEYEECLEAELRILGTWLDGGVYGYTIEEFPGGKVLDSCWGFIAEYKDTSDEGGWGYLIGQAKNAADDVAHDLKEIDRDEVVFKVTMRLPSQGGDRPAEHDIMQAIYEGTTIDTPNAITVEESK